jgi:hypothetical protein
VIRLGDMKYIGTALRQGLRAEGVSVLRQCRSVLNRRCPVRQTFWVRRNWCLGMQLYTRPQRDSQAANRAIAMLGAASGKRLYWLGSAAGDLARCQKWVAAAHSVKPVLIVIRSGAVPPCSALELGVDGLRMESLRHDASAATRRRRDTPRWDAASPPMPGATRAENLDSLVAIAHPAGDEIGMNPAHRNAIEH